MPYNLFIDGCMIGQFGSPDEALARVRQEMERQPNREFELRDSETDEPYAPAASKGWREQLANKVGY